VSTKSVLYYILNLLGLLFSAYASYAAFSLSRLHLAGPAVCPELLGVPACLIVLVCYVLIAVAWALALVLEPKLGASICFATGFISAFILALLGSAGEILSFGKCPATEMGTPKCFISLGFLVILAIAWVMSMRLKSCIAKA